MRRDFHATSLADHPAPDSLSIGILLGQAFYGSIVGNVNDSSGAALASTTVALTNIATGDRRTVITGSDGSYRFVNLVPGTYRMEIEHPGFKRYTRDQIDVSVESQVRADIVMQVGDVNQSVEVQAEAPLLQTETANLSQVVGIARGSGTAAERPQHPEPDCAGAGRGPAGQLRRQPDREERICGGQLPDRRRHGEPERNILRRRTRE